MMGLYVFCFVRQGMVSVLKYKLQYKKKKKRWGGSSNSCKFFFYRRIMQNLRGRYTWLHIRHLASCEIFLWEIDILMKNKKHLFG